MSLKSNNERRNTQLSDIDVQSSIQEKERYAVKEDGTKHTCSEKVLPSFMEQNAPLEKKYEEKEDLQFETEFPSFSAYLKRTYGQTYQYRQREMMTREENKTKVSDVNKEENNTRATNEDHFNQNDIKGNQFKENDYTKPLRTNIGNREEESKPTKVIEISNIGSRNKEKNIVDEDKIAKTADQTGDKILSCNERSEKVVSMVYEPKYQEFNQDEVYFQKNAFSEYPTKDSDAKCKGPYKYFKDDIEPTLSSTLPKRNS